MFFSHINDSILLKELDFTNLLAVIAVILTIFLFLILLYMVGILLGYYFKDKKISNTFCLELVEYFKRFKFKQAALFCFLAFLGLCALYGIYCLLDSSVERAIY
jgi:hypothetical protein